MPPELGGVVELFPSLRRDAPPQANAVATAASTSQISVTWSDVATETGYTVERSTDGGATWTRVATLANSTTYTNSNLKRNTTYVYRVAAYNAQGVSSYATASSVRMSQPIKHNDLLPV